MSTPNLQVALDTFGRDDNQYTGELFAVLAEFETVGDVTEAAKRVRDAGYAHWDVYSPFPIHGVDRSIGMVPTILPWIILAGGLTGLLGGLFMVWWTNATTFDFMPAFLQGYEYLISGKPIFSLPANIPILFETTILIASFAAVLGMLGLNKLPMLYNPLFNSQNFRRATDDRFFIAIETTDPQFDLQNVHKILNDVGGQNIEEVFDKNV